MRDQIFNGINTTEDVRNLLRNISLQGDSLSRAQEFLAQDFQAEKIKQNAKRKVFCLTLPSGECCYLKLYSRQRFPWNLFRFYPEKEYAAALELEHSSVPVISYLAWARIDRGGGICLSAGVPDAITARRYFYETARFNTEKKTRFLQHLAGLTACLRRGGYFHPDYHTGNILCAEQGEHLLLVDPWGIRKSCSAEKNLTALCIPWAELRGCLSREEFTEGILAAELAGDRLSAEELMERSVKLYETHFDHRWEHATRQRILRGDPKFCTVQKRADGIYFWHNTPWFTSPETTEPDPSWKRQSFSSTESSEELWLESFRKMEMENPPLVRVLHPDGSSELFYRS